MAGTPIGEFAQIGQIDNQQLAKWQTGMEKGKIFSYFKIYFYSSFKPNQWSNGVQPGCADAGGKCGGQHSGICAGWSSTTLCPR